MIESHVEKRKSHVFYAAYAAVIPGQLIVIHVKDF